MSNFSTLSVRGCWGQPKLLFWKLVDKTQISKPPEPTRHHNSIKLWILPSLRADLLYILQYETPCRIYLQGDPCIHYREWVCSADETSLWLCYRFLGKFLVHIASLLIMPNALKRTRYITFLFFFFFYSDIHKDAWKYLFIDSPVKEWSPTYSTDK